MRTIIPTLMIFSVLLLHSVDTSGVSPKTRNFLKNFGKSSQDPNYEELSSDGSSGSKSSGGPLPLSVDRRPLKPGERDIVHDGKILTRANFQNLMVDPFKKSGQATQFLQYKPVENQEPNHDEQFIPIEVTPQKWLYDICCFAEQKHNLWICHSAYDVYRQHFFHAANARGEEYEQKLQEFNRKLHEQLTKLRVKQ